jgi:antitoxin ParD1/3/4
MNIALTPELEAAVVARVNTGLFADASEVVRDALRQSLACERENHWLVREAAIGFAQLEAGETVTIETREQFKSVVRADT